MTQAQVANGCTFRFDRVDEFDALLADIGEHGDVCFATIRGGFQANFQGDDGVTEYTVKCHTSLDCLRRLYKLVVAE